MAGARGGGKLRAGIFEARATFRVPLEFAYRWCTDYSPQDPRIEGDDYVRRILHRSSRRVVYEDLEDTRHGWQWSRQVVTLQPPNAWHAEAVGNYRTWSLDYRLREGPEGSTTFRLRGLRTPTRLGRRNPPKVELERELNELWRKFGRAMERDFRRDRGRPARRPRG